MKDLDFRWMTPDEVSKLKQIDRSEIIRTGYRFTDGQLIQMDVNWDSPNWSLEGDGQYTMAAEIRFCQEHLDKGGRLFGAFDSETLVGIGLLQPEIVPKMAQLAYLHVTNGYRQRGIGEKIVAAVFEEAQRNGSEEIYVSAVPTGSAVGFYSKQGFVPTRTPNPALFELEPEDIHMIKRF